MKADATSLRLIRYNVSWIATPLTKRLKPSQVRIIKVWKVCLSYHRDGSVPSDVNTAHHIFYLHKGSIFKPEAEVKSAREGWTHYTRHR